MQLSVNEISEYAWLELDEATKRIKYPERRRMLRKAAAAAELTTPRQLHAGGRSAVHSGQRQRLVQHIILRCSGKRLHGVRPEPARWTHEDQSPEVPATLLPALQQHAPLIAREANRAQRFRAATARGNRSMCRSGLHDFDGGRRSPRVAFPATHGTPPAVE